MPLLRYRLGCPVWSFRGWVGSLYSRDARPADFLRQYASVFNSVEGNTTFYSEPSAANVLRWRQDTPPGFRFCFKLPQALTHERALVGVQAETQAFLARMLPLGERLGPFMVQLPSGFGPRQLGGLRAGPQDHLAVREARHAKPDLPVEPFATGPTPVVRFVAHPEARWNEPALEGWAAVLAAWLREGREPYLLMHCPDNARAPAHARRAHDLLTKHAQVGELPAWPGELGEGAQGQLRLL